MSQPPSKWSETAVFADLINFARFQLCKQKNILWKDSIWDRYTDEEILVEYYALLMEGDSAYLQEFEALIVESKDGVEDDIAWMQRKMKELRAEKESEREFNVTPNTLGK